MSRIFVYLHGQPGGPEELHLFGPLPWPADIPALALDRNRLSGLLDQQAPNGRFTLIGFSMGAKAALDLAARLPDRITHLHLIAAAGPPDQDIMLDKMAGGPLFRMARDAPRRFAILCRVQSAMARLFPSLLTRALLSTARGADAALAASPAFRTRMSAMLRAGLGHSSASYAAEISAYMRPWRDQLASIAVPVTLWHGEADNWAPIALAEDLAAALPGPVTFNRLPGLSHYSTLHHALRAIAAP